VNTVSTKGGESVDQSNCSQLLKKDLQRQKDIEPSYGVACAMGGGRGHVLKLPQSFFVAKCSAGNSSCVYRHRQCPCPGVPGFPGLAQSVVTGLLAGQPGFNSRQEQ
jgi:hypothetical protein